MSVELLFSVPEVPAEPASDLLSVLPASVDESVEEPVLSDEPAGASLATRVQHFRLTEHLVLQAHLDVAEGVHVFQLCLGSELFLTIWTDGYVGIATKGALLHAYVGYFGVLDNRFELFQIGSGFFRCANVWLGNDLYQRYADTVEVYQGL